MNRLLTASAIAALLVFTTAAYAVDIENQDNKDYEVTTVTGDGGPVTFKLKAGETKKNACNNCSIMLGADPTNWDAGDYEKMVIKDGKIHRQTGG